MLHSGLYYLSYDQRLAQLNLDSLEKRRHNEDLTELFKINDNISILNYSNFFPLQITLLQTVATINFKKLFTYELRK